MKKNQLISVPKSYISKLKELDFIDNDNFITEKFIKYYENYCKGKKDTSINHFVFIDRLIHLINMSLESKIISKIDNLKFLTYGIV